MRRGWFPVPGTRTGPFLALALLLGAGAWPAASAPSPASCARCHKAAAAELSAHGGKHQGFACGDCHTAKHPPKGPDRFPGCTGCHEGHGKEVEATDCARCHTAHRAAEVRYGLDVPSKLCGACHEDALASLEATMSRHKPLRCVICHQKEHGATQGCAHCHGSPHGSDAVRADGPCSSCHGPAHDLGKVGVKGKG